MLEIGNIRLENCLLAAPMAGFTDKAFRLILKKHGAGLVTTEMISAQALVYGQEKTMFMLDLTGEEPPVAVQIFGRDPLVMARAARLAADRGAHIIDINMGCPTPKIVKNGEGAALMKEPQLAARIVEAVAEAVDVPVTVKMRSGWDSSSINCCEIALLVQEAGARAVTVHPRTREQLFSGRADWSVIRAVKERVRIPVIGNGDVTSPENARQMLAETGCDGVMIGRGCLGNPFIFERTLRYLKTGELPPEPTVEERIRVAREHLALACRIKGEPRGVLEMRKHLAWYIKGLPHATAVRARMNQARTLSEIEAILDDTSDDTRGRFSCV